MKLVNTFLIAIITLSVALTAVTPQAKPKHKLQQDVPTVEAGIAATFTQSFFDEYKNQIMN